MPLLRGIGALPGEKGDKKILNTTSKIIIRTFIFFLVFFILLFYAFSAGWIQIVVTPNKGLSEIDSAIEEAEQSGKIGYIDSVKNVTDQKYSFLKHTIKPEETLFDLEKKYGTNWRVIQRINKINDPLRLKPGTIIYIPVRLSKS